MFSDEEIRNLLKDALEKRKIEEEIADVANYLLILCNSLNIDLITATESKLVQNEEKYPVKLCKGKSDKYTNYL